MTGTIDRPVHLIDTPGDRYVRCGVDTRTNAYGWAHYLPQWREGHARRGRQLIICPNCLGSGTEEKGRETAMPRGTPTLPTPDVADIEWREPPAATRGRPGVWHGVLNHLVERPGEWAMIRNAGTAQRAQGIASNLRSEKTSKPAGKWEFRARDEEVFARFIGPI